MYSASQTGSTLAAIPIGAPISGSAGFGATQPIPANTFYRSYDNSTNPAFVTLSLSANAAATVNNFTASFDLSLTWGHGVPSTTGTTTVLTDTTKSWPTNFWAGARLKFLAGNGVSQETPITANTANTLTYTAVTTAPDATTIYNILPIQPRNTT